MPCLYFAALVGGGMTGARAPSGMAFGAVYLAAEQPYSPSKIPVHKGAGGLA